MRQIGVDFGYSNLKLAEVETGWGGRILLSTSKNEIPAGAIGKSGIVETKKLNEIFLAGLKNASPHTMQARRVVTALPAGLIFTKLIELPKMSMAEINRTAPIEAHEAFPVPLEDLVLDWQIISKTRPISKITTRPDHAIAPEPPKPVSADPMLDVLLVAAPKTLVQSFVSFFDGLGFELVSLEIKPMANVRAVGSPKQTDTYLLIDLGAVASSFAIIDRNQVRHISTLNFGAEMVNSELKIGEISDATESTDPKSLPKLKLPKDEKIPAELLPPSLAKIKTKPGKSRRNRLPEPPPLQLPRETFEPLLSEIEQVIKFYEQRIQTMGKVSRIRLAGGGATIPKIASSLSEWTGIHTDLTNPLINLTNRTKLDSVQTLPFTTAIGLALREEE